MAIDQMPPALQRALAHKQRMAIAWRPNPAPAPTPIAVAPRRAPTPPAPAITLDDAALNEWADGLTARVGLQSELVWVGLNDGYVDAGGKDVAIPYLGLYWLLGAAKRSCVDCPPIAMGSPYDPPGKGPNPIYQSPGDGHTQCGAGCKCWLEYGLPAVSTPKNYAWSNNVFPGPGKATPEIAAERDAAAMRREATNYSWQEAIVLNPESEYFTGAQKGALDAFRAKWFAWEDVRGTLPQAPQMFAEAEGAQSLQDLDMFWNSLTDQQEKILIDLQEAIGAWNAATLEANAALTDTVASELPDGAPDQQLAEAYDDESVKLFGFHIGSGPRGGLGGVGSAFESLHPRDMKGEFKDKPEAHAAKSKGRGAKGEENTSHSASRKVATGEEKSPNDGAIRRVRGGAKPGGGREKAPAKTIEEKLVAKRETAINKALTRSKSARESGDVKEMRLALGALERAKALPQTQKEHETLQAAKAQRSAEKAAKTSAKTQAKTPDMAKLAAAKSTGEVEQWLNTSFPGTKFGLGAAHVDAARTLAQTTAELARAYPQFMPYITHVVSRDSNLYPEAADKTLQLKVVPRLSDTTQAATALVVGKGETGKSIIVLNPSLMSKNATLAGYNAAGFFGRGWGAVAHGEKPLDVAYSMRHEFMHTMDQTLTYGHLLNMGKGTISVAAHDSWIGAKKSLQKAFDTKFKGFGGFVSRYAKTSREESLAEIFAGHQYGDAVAQRQFQEFLAPTLALATGTPAANLFSEPYDDETIALFGGGFFGGFHIGGEGGSAGRPGMGGSAFESLHPRGMGGKFRFVNGGHHAGEGGRRGFGGEHEGERGGGKRVSSEAESRARRSPNEGASRRVLRGKINDSERTSRLATMAKRTGSAEKSPNEGAARRTNAVKAKGVAGLHEASAKWQADNHAAPESKPGAKLEAIHGVEGHTFDPYAHLDPHYLAQVYGEHQLGAALSRYSVGRLRESATDLGLKNTGNSKAAIVSHITAHVTRGHYSANFPKAAPVPRAAKAGEKGAAKSAPEKESAKLVPVRSVANRKFDPYAPIEPRYLRALYGDKQLHAALDRYSLTRLRESAKLMGIKTGPGKEGAINAITEHLSHESEGQSLARIERAGKLHQQMQGKSQEVQNRLQKAIDRLTWGAPKGAKPAAAPKSSAKAAKAPKPVKSPEEKLVAQRTTQLAKAKAENEAAFHSYNSGLYGEMAHFKIGREEWFGPEGPRATSIKAAELNLAHAQALTKGETAWKGTEQSTPFSKSEFLHATLKPMNSRLQGHNPGFTAKIGETTYHVKLVQHDELLANEKFIPYLKGSENATYQAHAEQAATEIGHLLGVGSHMVDAHSFQVGANHFVATKFQTGMKPVGDQEKGATPAREAALFKSLGEGGAAQLTLHEYLTGNGDLHAANVLMSAKTGEVKLLDFGRAFTQPGALMQGGHSETRPIMDGWFRATAAKLGVTVGRRTLGGNDKSEQQVYKAMKFPKADVERAIANEGKIIGVLKTHGLTAAVKTTQARFNLLKQLGDDTSIQHFDELQVQAFSHEGNNGGGAVDFSESPDDAIQLWGIGGALRAAFGGKGALGGLGGHFADGREVLRGKGGKFNGSTKGAGHEKTSSSRGHKGEEEHTSGGRGHKAQEQERVKSPNEGANRRMGRGERKAAEKAATEHAAKAKTENDAKLAAFKQTHDDSPLARQMPFTREEFLAQGTGGQTLRGGRMAETRLTTINGERYVVKRLVGGYQREEHDAQGNVVDRESPYGAAYREAKAEVAGGHIAKIVGLGESVAHDAFVLTHNGQLYSIQTFERGSPLTRLSNSEHAKFDEANSGAEGEKRMLTEYLVGRVDGHGGNYLFNSATGGVKIIDFGNDFTGRTYFNPLQNMVGRSVLATHGGRSSERDSHLRPQEMKSIKLDKSAIHGIVSHAAQIRADIAKFHFDEGPALLTRLAHLEKLDEMEAPTMHDLITISGGREVKALGGTKYEGLG